MQHQGVRVIRAARGAVSRRTQRGTTLARPTRNKRDHLSFRGIHIRGTTSTFSGSIDPRVKTIPIRGPLHDARLDLQYIERPECLQKSSAARQYFE